MTGRLHARLRAVARHARSVSIAGPCVLLAACSQAALSAANVNDLSGAAAAPVYAAVATEKFPIPAVDGTVLAPQYRRQRVRYATAEPPGTIVVDPAAKYLYLVMEDGFALRYGIGVGREGFGWSGTATIRRKAQWPTWTPPQAMIRRQPELERYSRGMEPGLDNPLGARALYLFQGDQDTLYRIHGTNEPDSIGKNVSSGCIRLLNQDVIDLYSRTPVGSKVVVLPDRSNAQTAHVGPLQ